MTIRTMMLTLTAAAMMLAAPQHASAQDKPGHVHRRHIHRHRHRRPPRPIAVARSLVSVSLESAHGSQLRTFRHRGRTYVLGNNGSRYNIRVSNKTNRRLEVVVGVDGRDVINGKVSSSTDRGYVIPGHGSVTIRGFRTSMSSVAAFRFTSPSASYAGRHGHAYSAGVIRVAAYRERPQPVLMPSPLPHRHRHSGEAQPPSAGAKQKRPTASAPSADRARGSVLRRPRTSSNLGTQFGEHTHSQVRQTQFIRSNRYRPDQRLALRYDDAQGLEARGIVVFKRPPPPPYFPEPLPPMPLPQSRFAQPPP